MITEEMIYELNEIFRAADSIIRFKLRIDSQIECSYKLVPASTKYIDSYSIILDTEGREVVEHYFNQRGIKINWNANYTIFY